jgi:O-methyltransferase involved in polyketide biosynthesis
MATVDEPNTARMIDYWLGGRHHFPVDVAAARTFEDAYGPVAHEFRTLREFLQRVVRRMTEQGIDEFLVVGAGVPTQGNVHEAAPDARVLYVDLDPANVALGQEILADHATAAYALGDAMDLSTIDPTVLHATLPGWGIRPTGAAFLGLAAFFDDEPLSRAFDGLYEAVAPGSMLAFDFDTDVLAAYPEAVALMGPAFRMRAPEAFPPLLGRWELTEEGVAPVAGWGLADAGSGGDAAPAAFYGGLAARGS